MKKSVLLIVAVATIALVVSQVWETPKPVSKQIIKKEEGDGPRPDRPGEAAAMWGEVLETPNGENPALLNYQAREQILQNREDFGAITRPNFKFEDMGPGNFGGRVRSIVINPDDTKQILTGGVFGGIFRTVDGGTIWSPSDDFLSSLAIGSMIGDPDNSDRVFAGTGEGFFNFGLARGLGILRSDDFGQSWTPLDSTLNSNFFFVNRLARIPSSDVLIAATQTGIWRSADLGATWNEVSGFSTSSRGFVDLKVDPTDNDHLLAVHYGGAANNFLMESNDGGLNWNQLGAAEGLPTTNIARHEIAFGADGVAYASIANGSDQTRGLWRSPAGTTAFAKTASNTPYIERQGWYDLMIGVDPFDSNNVFLGAVDVFRTNDSGTTITRITDWSPAAGAMDTYVHADIHAIAFDPNNAGTLYIGCDGGIYKSTDGGNSFSSLNTTLKLSQPYGMAISPDGTQVITGTQDNGSQRFIGDDVHWIRWAGGDGGFCAWDQQQPEFVYGSTPAGGMFGSNDGGLTTTALPLPTTAGARFIQPFTIDPKDGNRMIVGTNSVLFTNNLRQLGTSNWTVSSGVLGTLLSTTISPHNGSVAYVGTTAGNVFRTTDLGTGNNWTQLGGGLPSGMDATWIEVDPHDATGNTVYATFGDYGGTHVFKSLDAGDTWTDISGNLPSIPTFCIRVDPTDPNRLFLGSEMGLWTTDDNSEGVFVWEQYDSGPAWSRVIQMQFGDDNTLWLSYHGRGTFRGTREALSSSLGLIIDTGSGEDGYLDQGEMATLPVSLTNNGTVDASGISVTVSTTYAGIVLNNATQDFPTLSPGETLTNQFDIHLETLAACLDVATITVTVNGSETALVETHEITLGANPDLVTGGTYTEDAESADTEFTSFAFIGTNDWQRDNSQARSGSFSWFASDADSWSDKSLQSPVLSLADGSTTIRFWLRYDMEFDGTQHWDGAVMEMRIGDGHWFDIGSLSTIAYDGVMFQSGASLHNRPVWSGQQTTWREGVINFGSTYNGQDIQFRFRISSDTNTGAPGFWVDDISITNVNFVNELLCDTEACLTCYDTLADALAAMYESLGNGEWPASQSVLDYTATLNNTCP